MNTNTASRPRRLSDIGLLLLLALCGALIHVLLNGQYGFHRDELDIIMNARQLDWGYAAYPPITPFIARIGLELFGNSLQGLRLFSTLGQGLVMLLVGLMVRDMGGAYGGHAHPVHGLRLRVMGNGRVLHRSPAGYLPMTRVTGSASARVLA